jgi:hypothetical protein
MNITYGYVDAFLFNRLCIFGQENMLIFSDIKKTSRTDLIFSNYYQNGAESI